MRRFILRSFVAGGVLASTFLVADIEKVRPEGNEEKGKEDQERDGAKPEPEMGKPGRQARAREDADHQAIHRRLEAEGEETLKEIARLMEKVRNDLSRKQTGDSTQGDQKEVVKKIQDLIDKIQKGCGNPG